MHLGGEKATLVVAGAKKSTYTSKQGYRYMQPLVPLHARTCMHTHIHREALPMAHDHFVRPVPLHARTCMHTHIHREALPMVHDHFARP